MSSDGDNYAFDKSINDNMEEDAKVPFSEKKYAFITDSTSNSGSFASGQIQFDLSTLNSQSQWVDLSAAQIEFPVKMSITQTASNSATTFPSAGINSIIMKSSWTSWVDGCQLIVNGQTIQSAQPYENVSATFRQLSQMSQDSLQKWGTTCNIALDDCTGSSNMNGVPAGCGLANAVASTVASDIRGFDAVNSNAILYNSGLAKRARNCNLNIKASVATVATVAIGTTNIKQSGKHNVETVAGLANTAGTVLYTGFFMATVKLSDVMDISDWPLQKNLKGFLYLSMNGCTTILGSTGGVNAVNSVTNNITSGRCCPYLINTSNAANAVQPDILTTLISGGVIHGTISSTITVVGAVDATTTASTMVVGASTGPPLVNARLIIPFYLANPKADLALTQHTKYFSTLEKIVNPFVVPAGSSVNYTITTGVANPTRLLLLPMWQGFTGTTTPNATLLPNPEQSCFDTVPTTSGVYAQLKQLQCYIANRPIFQYPMDYDFEMYQSEIADLGLHGSQVEQQTSGLLSQQLWEQNHRFYTVDLSRRIAADDGASKSIQVSFTNPSATYGMKVISVVYFQKRWVMDTASGLLTSV